MTGSPRQVGTRTTRPSAVASARNVVIMILLAAAIVTLVGVQLWHAGVGISRGPAAAPPWPVMPPASATIDIGLTTLALSRNSWRRWQPSDLVTVNEWEQAIRKHASVVMWYADWTTGPPSARQLDAIAERRSIPEITWEPWRSHPAVTAQPKYRLQNIIDGRFDPYIRSWAKRLAAHGLPVRLRFAQEMNGRWYPWSEFANGNHRGEFVQAWRHVHRIFRAAGATNVRWVWSPAAITMRPEQYPGDAYVDLVAMTMFNGGLQLRYANWQPFERLITRALKQLKAIAPRRNVELSELASAEQGGSKAAWIRGMFASLRRHPEIKSVIWYDLVKGSDWRVASSEASIAAFAAGVAHPRYR